MKIRKEMKDWVVVDPYSSEWFVESFHTESEATSWIISKSLNDDSMADLEVMRKREALEVYDN